MTDYPKVLIIIKTLINDIDSGGSLRNWFKEWPREHLAQLYSGVAINRDPFCGFNFQIGSDERRFGRLFSKLKSSPLGDAAQPFRHMSGSTQNGSNKWWRKAVYKTGKLLTQSGLWELMFPPLLSPNLKLWIETFRPDVLFCQGSDISFMRLPLIIHKAYGTPVCMNTVDDWVEHRYEQTPLARLMQPVVRKTFRNLARVCSQRFTIGDLMAKEYQVRYGVGRGTSLSNSITRHGRLGN